MGEMLTPRSERDDREAAAIKLQSASRVRLAKRELRIEKEAKEKADAATRIQCRQRQLAAQKEAKRLAAVAAVISGMMSAMSEKVLLRALCLPACAHCLLTLSFAAPRRNFASC